MKGSLRETKKFEEEADLVWEITKNSQKFQDKIKEEDWDVREAEGEFKKDFTKYEVHLEKFINYYVEILKFFRCVIDKHEIKGEGRFHKLERDFDGLYHNAVEFSQSEWGSLFIENTKSKEDIRKNSEEIGGKYRSIVKKILNRFFFLFLEGPAMADMVYRADHSVFKEFIGDIQLMNNQYGSQAASHYICGVITQLQEPELELIIERTEGFSDPIVDYFVSGAAGAEPVLTKFRDIFDIWGSLFSSGLYRVIFLLPDETKDEHEKLKQSYVLLEGFNPSPKNIKSLETIINQCPMDLRAILLERIIEEPSSLPVYEALVKHGLRADNYIKFILYSSDITLPDESKKAFLSTDYELPQQLCELNFIENLSSLGGPFGQLAVGLLNIPNWYEDTTLYSFIDNINLRRSYSNFVPNYLAFLEHGQNNKRQILNNLIALECHPDRLRNAVSIMGRLDDDILTGLRNEQSLTRILNNLRSYDQEHKERVTSTTSPKITTPAIDKRQVYHNLIIKRYGFEQWQPIASAYEILEKQGLEYAILKIAKLKSEVGMDRFLHHVELLGSGDDINSNFSFLLSNPELSALYIDALQEKIFDDDSFIKKMNGNHSNPYRVFRDLLSKEEVSASYGVGYIEKPVVQVTGERVYFFGGRYSEERKNTIDDKIQETLGIDTIIYDFPKLDNVGLGEYKPDEGDVVICTTAHNKHLLYYQLKAMCKQYDIPFYHCKTDGTDVLIDLAKERIIPLNPKT